MQGSCCEEETGKFFELQGGEGVLLLVAHALRYAWARVRASFDYVKFRTLVVAILLPPGVKEVPRKLATTLTHRKPFLCALLHVALPTRYARVEGTTVRLDVVRFTAVHALVSLLTSGRFHLR